MGKEIVSIRSHERERDNVKVTRTCYGKNERTRYVIYYTSVGITGQKMTFRHSDELTFYKSENEAVKEVERLIELDREARAKCKNKTEQIINGLYKRNYIIECQVESIPLIIKYEQCGKKKSVKK